MLGGDTSNLIDVVVLQLIDVTNYLALVGSDSSKKEQILEVLIITEGRGLDDDLLQQFDEFEGKVSGKERFDSD